MDIESVGAGVGTGLIGSTLVALGFKSRLEKLENNVVYKDTCQKCSLNNDNQIRSIHESQQRMEKKLDESQQRMEKKLDAFMEKCALGRSDMR